MDALRNKFKLRDLRDLCSEYDLPVTGLKDDLILRIVSHLCKTENVFVNSPPSPPPTTSSTRAKVTIIGGLKGKMMNTIRNLFQTATTRAPTHSSSVINLMENFLQSTSSTSNVLIQPIEQSNFNLFDFCKRRFEHLLGNIPIALGAFGGLFALLQLYYARINEPVPGRTMTLFW